MHIERRYARKGDTYGEVIYTVRGNVYTMIERDTYIYTESTPEKGCTRKEKIYREKIHTERQDGQD